MGQKKFNLGALELGGLVAVVMALIGGGTFFGSLQNDVESLKKSQTIEAAKKEALYAIKIATEASMKEIKGSKAELRALIQSNSNNIAHNSQEISINKSRISGNSYIINNNVKMMDLDREEIEQIKKSLVKTSVQPGKRIDLSVGASRAWGNWTGPKYCPVNHHVCGLELKTEEWQRDKDDTGATQVGFFCCPN